MIGCFKHFQEFTRFESRGSTIAALQIDDRFYTKYNVTCIDFVRSSPAPRQNCALGPRDQVIDRDQDQDRHDDYVLV